MENLDMKVLRNTLIMGVIVLTAGFLIQWAAMPNALDALKAAGGMAGAWLLGYAQRTGGFTPSVEGFKKTVQQVTPLLLVCAALALTGCEKIKAVRDSLIPPAVTNIITQPSAPATKPLGEMWAAHQAPRFMVHGEADENTYRTSALDTAKAQGRDCIRCDFNWGASDELLIHLTCIEHPFRPNYFNEQDNWFFMAERGWGVTKWVYDVGALDSGRADRLAFVYRHPVAKGRVQLNVSLSTPPEVIQQLQTKAVNVEVIAK